MTNALILVALLLPLTAILWLTLWPQRYGFALTLQIAGGLALTLGVTLVAIWTNVPQWIMLAYLTLWAVASVRGFRNWRATRDPINRSGWVAVGVGAVALLAGSWLAAEALLARQLPPVAVIDLAVPLDRAGLVVVNGGSRLLVNAHQDVLDLSIARHRLWTGQAYGIDIVALNRWSMSSDGFRPADPQRYAIFAEVVSAPCAGAITAMRDGRPDLKIPQVDTAMIEGNFVILRCGAVEVALAHLQRGSVAVRMGQLVKVGDLIGRVGNSGLSDEPHLHINAQTPGTSDAPFSGRPVAMRFGGRLLARNDRI